MLAKTHKVMLHDMYDAIECVLSVIMIYECNGCACKLNKPLTAAGDSKPLIAETEKSFGLLLGVENPW